MKVNSILSTILLCITLLSCNKKDEEQPQGTGAGAESCGYTQLSSEGIPQLVWMLEGTKSEYQDYNSNVYYKYGQTWSLGSCGGDYKIHNAWDIHKVNQAPIANATIYAVYEGIVKAVYDAGTGFAQGITIEHTDMAGNKFTSNYTHVIPNAGLQGKEVATGEAIGHVADLGEYPDHLHFSIRRSPYDNTANRGALPKYNGSCQCSANNITMPVFPEYFINPGLINYQDRNGSSNNSGRVISITGTNPPLTDIGKISTFTISISNIGDEDLVISNFKLLDDPDNYFYFPEGLPQMPFSVPVGGQRQIKLAFQPVNGSHPYTANFKVTSNATSGTDTYLILGDDIDGPGGVPTIGNVPSTPIETWVGCTETIPFIGSFEGFQYATNIFKVKLISYNSLTGEAMLEWGTCSGSNAPGISTTSKNLVLRVKFNGFWTYATGYFGSSDTKTISIKANLGDTSTEDFNCFISVYTNGTYSYYYAGRISINP